MADNKPKKRRGDGYKYSPIIGSNGLMVEDGDNAKFLSANVELLRLPDINLRDVDQVEARLQEYFNIYAKYDMKPTVAGMALALNGMSRTNLWAIANDRATGSDGYKSALPKEVTTSIKKAYKIMENLWETYMNSGKINPVTGIFLGKNNFNYMDKTDIVVTPKSDSDKEVDVDEIRKRYIPQSIPIDAEASDSET